jgi:hypothetical protein
MRTYSLRHLGQTAKYLLISLALLYAADWSAFEARLVRGAGLGSVPMEQYLKTSLKGGNCARAMFPQYAASQWNPPCWWLERHRQRWH